MINNIVTTGVKYIIKIEPIQLYYTFADSRPVDNIYVYRYPSTLVAPRTIISDDNIVIIFFVSVYDVFGSVSHHLLRCVCGDRVARATERDRGLHTKILFPAHDNKPVSSGPQ